MKKEFMIQVKKKDLKTETPLLLARAIARAPARSNSAWEKVETSLNNFPLGWYRAKIWNTTQAIWGSLVRLVIIPLLNKIPPKIVFPILSGKLIGTKWMIGSGCYTQWLGNYESKKTKLFAESITDGDVVYDLGAHVGFYTLLASKLVGLKGAVYAFEPLRRNNLFLKKHIEINNLTNVKVFETVVTNVDGWLLFKKHRLPLMGRVSDTGQKVRSIRLDTLFKKGKILPPTHLKIDVEGSEYDVLLGAEELLTKFHPVIFLSTHDQYYNIAVHQQCLCFLRKLGYIVKPIDGFSLDQSAELYAQFIYKPISKSVC